MADPHPRCITCGDDARAMRVLRADAPASLAVCTSAGGARQEVDTALVGAVGPGQALLVHAGVALARVEDAG
jgi:hydrogenase maturation factor